MPATEKTWYDQKLLHVVFGLSSIVMLLATVWMFAADHDREWKGYQRNFRNAEQRLTTWRMGAEESERQSDHQRLLEQLVQAQLEIPSGERYEEFKAEVQDEAQQRGAPSVDFTQLDKYYQAIDTAAAPARQALSDENDAEGRLQTAQEALVAAKKELASSTNLDERKTREAVVKDAAEQVRVAEKEATEAADTADDAVAALVAARQRLFDDLGVLFQGARDRETEQLSRRKFRSADFDAARADLDLMVRDNRTAEMPAQQAVIDELKADLDKLSLERQAATDHRKQLQQTLAAMTKDVDAIERKSTPIRVN